MPEWSLESTNKLADHFVQSKLAYNNLTTKTDGSVIRQQEKALMREHNGDCTECEGPPVLLYTIKRLRTIPLLDSKTPRTIAGECAHGICLVCHPEAVGKTSKARRG
jgi:hypothetical protein